MLGILAACLFATAGISFALAQESSLYKKYGFDFNESAEKVQVLGAAEIVTDGAKDLFKDAGALDSYVPAKDINQNNREFTIRLPERVNASDYAFIHVYLLINQWETPGDPDTVASFVSVSAYAPSDSEFANPAGTLRGNKNSNTVDILRIDPKKVADKDGYVRNIVLRVDCDAKKYATAVYLNYVELTETLESLYLQTGKQVVATENPEQIADPNVTWFYLKDNGEKNEPYGYVEHPAFNFMNEGTFPGAKVENDVLLLRNAVFAVKLGKINASLYAQMNIDLLFADWNAGRHDFYLYGSGTTSFTDERGNPVGYVKKLTTVGAETRANFKLGADELRKLADSSGAIDYIYIMWGGNERDTADRTVGCPTNTSIWMNEIVFLIEEDVPKPVVPTEKNSVDISDLFPTGNSAALNFQAEEENKNKVLTQAAVSMDSTDEINFGIKPATDTYSIMFLLRAADNSTMQDAWLKSGVFFWFSNDNITLGSYKDNTSSGMTTLLAKDYPKGAFAKGKITNVKMTLLPFYIDGVEAGYYAAVTIGSAQTPQMEMYFYSEDISTGNYLHFAWQDLGKDIGFELSALKQDAKSAQEVMGLKLETSNGETGKVTLEKERATVKASWYSMAGEKVSEIKTSGAEIEFNRETGRVVFQKKGSVSLSFTVTNVFGTFESPVLELSYGVEGGGCTSAVVTGVLIGAAVLVLICAITIIIFRRKKVK